MGIRMPRSATRRPRGRAAFALLSAGVTSVCLLPAGQAGASTSTLPNSMASTGDSISRAFDIDPQHFLQDSPQYSWSTGTSTTVDSQYQRILAANHAIRGNEYNDAKTGAQMSALASQLSSAASQKVQYVTILMGANDVCTSSPSTMTSTSTFESEFDQALSNFTAADPGARVFVSSIPNIYQLWQLFHNNSTAEWTWTTYGICQSMLSQSGTDTTRQEVVSQEQADNNALATVCGQFSQCRWDGLATYNTTFQTNDVSTADYFHPSYDGQNLVATETWAAGYWPGVA